MIETIYFAGGCLWGVQAYMKTLPGVLLTEAGRANGTSKKIDGPYDGYSECVKTEFNPEIVSVKKLMAYFFEIIDPHSVNKQGADVGEKYRTGVYSSDESHLKEAKEYINSQDDSEKIVVEILPLSNYVKSADENQDRLTRCPNDYCHISKAQLNKYKVDKN